MSAILEELIGFGGADAAQAETIYSVVGLDPGLDVSGYCVLEWCVEKKTFRFIKMGSIQTPANTETLERAKAITNGLKGLEKTLRGKVIYVVERPRECLYGKSPDRFAGVLKLFAIIYSILGSLHERAIITFPIYPSDWESDFPKETGTGVKVWSRLKADQKLLDWKVSRPKHVKFKGKDQDIADAVNITAYGVKKLFSGEWVLPPILPELPR